MENNCLDSTNDLHQLLAGVLPREHCFELFVTITSQEVQSVLRSKIKDPPHGFPFNVYPDIFINNKNIILFDNSFSNEEQIYCECSPYSKLILLLS